MLAIARLREGTILAAEIGIHSNPREEEWDEAGRRFPGATPRKRRAVHREDPRARRTRIRGGSRPNPRDGARIRSAY